MDWKAEYSVQIPEIDREHQGLVDGVTAIERARSGDETQNSCIAKLIYSTRAHFTLEETLMRIMGYSDIDAHIKGHKKFLEDLKGLEKESLAGPLPQESLARLRAWLEDHFVSDDRQYASMLSKENREYVRRYYT
jgi:hemerythrin